MIGSSLQKALYAAIVAADATGDRVYDQVPKDAVFPYVTIGNEQVLDAGDSCSDGWEAFPDVHIWSRPAAGSKAEVKDLAADVIAAVLAITDVTGFIVVSAAVESNRTLRDPDGITEHAVLTFKFILDPA